MKSETSAQMRDIGNLEDQVVEKTATGMLVAVSEAPVSEIKRIIHGSVVTLEGTYQGKPIRVRIFGEPPQEPALERKENEEIKLSD